MKAFVIGAGILVAALALALLLALPKTHIDSERSNDSSTSSIANHNVAGAAGDRRAGHLVARAYRRPAARRARPAPSRHEQAADAPSASPIEALDTELGTGRFDGAQEAALRATTIGALAAIAPTDDARVEGVACNSEVCRVTLSYGEHVQHSQILAELMRHEAFRGELFTTHPDDDGRQHVYMARVGARLSQLIDSH